MNDMVAGAAGSEPRRPADDDVVAIGEALAWQARYCRQAGSPTAASILRAVQDDLSGGGDLVDLIPPAGRFGDLPGLRIMAAVHRLALERRVPRVALYLPTLGGTPPATADQRAEFAAAVVAGLTAYPDQLRHSLSHTPQTNETSRAALLRAALSTLSPQRPIRLFEVGASAGLNLRADQLPGDPALEAGPLPPVVHRVGCDLAPVDPDTQEGRTLLTSYVWVDDLDRFERLRQALLVAARVPAEVQSMDAGAFVDSLALRAGTTTVLWHSAMWVYLPSRVRQRILAGAQRLGRAATRDSTFVHVTWEWDPASVDSDQPFALVLRSWSGAAADGAPVLLARGMSHGRPAALVPREVLARDPLYG